MRALITQLASFAATFDHVFPPCIMIDVERIVVVGQSAMTYVDFYQSSSFESDESGFSRF